MPPDSTPYVWVMKSIVAVIAIAAAALAGCGGTTTGRNAAATGSPAAVNADGEYRIGVDVAPGVYASINRPKCTAFVASSPHFDITTGDFDHFVGTTTEYPGHQRIVLPKGDYFSTRHCSPWTRESAAMAERYDPATLRGACTLLVQGGLLHHAELLLHGPASSATAHEANALQFQLFAIVAARNPSLASLTGRLIDGLDNVAAEPGQPLADPSASLTQRASATVASIRETCRMR